MCNHRIKQLAEDFYPQIVTLRHHFHQYPELAFEEHKTSAKVVEALTAAGIEVTSGIAKTGVVGLIRGAKPGPTVLLRADMDALRVTEEADVPYCSQVPGIMHACGHDGHTAGLVGAALILNEMKEELQGNVKVVFQPAEESAGGAKPMIDAGVLENPKVDAAFGCHLWGTLEEGAIEVKSGPMMASPDIFEITMIGKGGHAAMPHLCIDPVIMATEVITQTQAMLTRRKNPLHPAVVSFTRIHGGETHNVIPNTVQLAGTIRTFDEEVRTFVPDAMEKIADHVTQTHGGSYSFTLHRGFPALINDADMTDLVEQSAAKIVGETNVHRAPLANMGGEDFAYFAAHVPSAFFFVGIKPEGGEDISHHHPKFAWEDQNMKISMKAMAQVAIDYLKEHSKAKGGAAHE